MYSSHLLNVNTNCRNEILTPNTDKLVATFNSFHNYTVRHLRGRLVHAR